MENSINLLLQQFKTQLINFLQALIEMFPEKIELNMLQFMLKEFGKPESIINKFINALEKNNEDHRHKIYSRNDAFLIETDLFDSITEATVDFKELWLSDVMDKENKDIVWSWIDMFLSIADKYKTLKAQL